MWQSGKVIPACFSSKLNARREASYLGCVAFIDAKALEYNTTLYCSNFPAAFIGEEDAPHMFSECAYLDKIVLLKSGRSPISTDLFCTLS